MASALDRLSSIASHIKPKKQASHPLDPLSPEEIEYATSTVRNKHGQLGYNAVTLLEPPKRELLAWLGGRETTPKPTRKAEVVAVNKTGGVFEGIVNLENGQLEDWKELSGVQPIVRSFSIFMRTG